MLDKCSLQNGVDCRVFFVRQAKKSENYHDERRLSRSNAGQGLHPKVEEASGRTSQPVTSAAIALPVARLVLSMTDRSTR